MDEKGHRHELASQEELIEAIRGDRSASVSLMWTPDHAFMIMPEEWELASDAVISSRRVRAELGRVESKKWTLLLAGGVVAYVLYLMFATAGQLVGADLQQKLEVGFQVAKRSMVVGGGLLALLIFGLIPWYQSVKRLKELDKSAEDQTAELIPVLRFETWMDLQKTPVTKALMVIVGLIGLMQLLPSNSIELAGLVKPLRVEGQPYEWWRLLTYSLLHGNEIHFLMNAAALMYLGKRVEVFAKWPHLLVVFIFASWAGAELSVECIDATTVGASGGLMGWLGFLLVFELLHDRLVPQSARRRLLAGVLLTVLIGVIGYRFIDNAVHAGGLLAGMIYAAVVFIKSKSTERPRIVWVDMVVGGMAGAVILATAVMTGWLLI